MTDDRPQPRDDWPEATQPGSLTVEQARAPHDQYWPCDNPRSHRHRYHYRAGCRDGAWRYHLAHGGQRRRRWQVRWHPKPDGTWRITTPRTSIPRGRWST